MVEKLSISALYNAIKECRLKPVEDSLQQYGIPKNTKKTTDYLVLQTAVDKNHKYVAKLLINAGCRVKPNDNEKDSGWTPLALTIIRGNIETAVLLLNNGAGSEAGNKSGLTVLHLAVRKKSLDMIRLLLCYMSINLVDSKGHTVLQTFFQVVCNQINVDRFGLENNVKILELLITKGASLFFENDPYGYSPLHYATMSKQVGLISKIIEKTRNVNVVSKTGNTSLHILLSDTKTYTRGTFDMVKLLVRNGANIFISNNQNETLLHTILSRYHINEENFFEIIQFFIEKGANINIQNRRRESACHIAARKKCLRVLHLFLQQQCQIDLQDYEDNTILHRLLQNSINFRSNDAYIEIVYSVLELGPALEIRNAEGKTPLDLIIQNKQARLLVRVLAENIDINAADDNGNTALHNYLIDLKEKNYKIDENVIQIVELLSSNGANVDLANKNNKTPVKLAFKLQKNECNTRINIYNIVLQLLRHSNDLDNLIGKGKTILHIMSQLKKPFEESEDIKAAEIVRLCLRNGATIDIRDLSDLTPLHLAVANKQQHVVKVLLEHKADPNLIIIPLSQVTVLQWILKMQEHSDADIEIAGLLLSHGATIDESPDSEFSLHHYITLPNKFGMCSKLIAYSTNVNIVDDLENTVLHKLLQSQSDNSSEENVCKVATELLLKGNLINSKNNEGLTPLHLAVKQKFYKVTEVLLNHHADPMARDNIGNCALHFTVLTFRIKPDLVKDLKMVQLLIKRGCDVNTCNNYGVTPLSEAIQTKCIGLVKALIRYKADVNLFTEDLLTPLHIAAEHGCSRITEHLIKYGAIVNAKKVHGKTALHVAIIHNNSNIVEILLKNGADPNMMDSDGRTAISLACWYSKFEIVKTLLNSGADINLADNFHRTPLDFAQSVIRMEFLRHIQKLKAAKMFIAHQNLRINQNDDSLFGDLEKEVTKLKEIKIDSQKSLADVLQMSQHELKSFKNNENFQKHINSDDFHEQFPFYADILKACYTRGVIRSDLLAQAKICFRELLKMPLPDICCDLIFGFLSNDSLQDLLTSTKLKNKVRKRRSVNDDNKDEDFAAPPAKRQRRISV